MFPSSASLRTTVGTGALVWQFSGIQRNDFREDLFFDCRNGEYIGFRSEEKAVFRLFPRIFPFYLAMAFESLMCSQ